jgi:hypothetical protein
MNTIADPARLGPASTAFVLAASITFLFNTALAWAKDAYPPLNSFMKSLTGHHWTTHGLADIIVFVGLGLIFLNTKAAEKIGPERLVSILIWSVVAASVGLLAWFALF